MTGLRDIVVTSVPPHERALAQALLPDARLEESPLTVDVARRHPHARVLAVAYHDAIREECLDAMPRLEAVVTRSDGFDHLPEGLLAARGIPGYHLGDYAAPAVADFTLGLILALLRRMPEAMAVTSGRRGGHTWDRSNLAGRGLRDVTIGVLGTGRIGSRVVRTLDGLGARVIGHDLAPDTALEKETRRFEYMDSLDVLLAASDVLTLHVPLTPVTRRLLDEAALAKLPPHAVLVNTARGALVDAAAVAAALDSGRLAGYAADVLEGEPAPPDASALAARANVLLTPHVAAYDAGTIRERYARTARIAASVLEGRTEAVRALECVPSRRARLLRDRGSRAGSTGIQDPARK